MKSFCLIVLTFSLCACASNPVVERTHYEDFEKQIGFTQVIKEGNRLYVSGITASGPDMESAVKAVYSSIQRILENHNASMGEVIKENLYTTDMTAMREQINTRKQFYPDGQYPAATWVEVKGLYLPEFILEVEVEAVISAE